MKRKALIIAVVLSGLVSMLFCGSDVFADVDGSKIIEKWFLTQYIQCVSQGGINESFANQSTSNKRNEEVAKKVFSDSLIKIWLPSYNYGGMKSDDKGITCDEMFRGSSKTSNKGLLSFSDLDGTIKWNSDGQKIDGFLGALGYEKTGNDTRTIQISMNKETTGSGFNDIAEMPLGEVISYNNNTGNYSVNQKLFTDYFKFSVDNNKKVITVKANVRNQHSGQTCGLSKEAFEEESIAIGASFDATVNNIKNKLGNLHWTFDCINNMTIDYSFPPASEFVVTGTGGVYNYVDTRSTLDNAIKNMTGINSIQGVFLSPSERYTLYLYYLQVASSNNIVCDVDNYQNMEKVKIKDSDGKINRNCFVGLNGQKPNEIPVYIQSERSDNHSVPKIEKKSLQDVIDWLNNVSDNELADVAALGEVNNGVEPLDSDNEEDICFANSGALGWIICPIIEAMHGVGKTMWTQIEEYHLKIPAQKVFESGGGVEQGWNIVRNIANVVFIIILLFVIFSQLTGVGIDNYGIKKILPKLIVIAILVNLSYLICGIVVDLSNILGMGLNNLLSSAGGTLGVATEGASGGAQVTSWALTTVLAGGGFYLFNYLQAGSVSGAFVGMGLAVLGIFIIIVVAMLTLYLILIIREAGIVLAVVIAPVAIVCYALPNTEKLAKKWFDVLKALLVVYPICGAMVGGGQLAGSILASIGNSGMSVAAMIVQVLPFFLVPVILKNSLSLLGNIGARVSSFGGKIGRRGSSGARGAIRNSERYKALANEGQRQKQMRFNERRERQLANKLERLERKGGSLNERDSRRLARSRAQLLQQREEDARVDDLVGTGYEARQAGIEAKMDADRVSNAEAMLQYGRVSGTNVNDAASMGKYLDGAMERYRTASNPTEKANALAEIKAAQNIMSKTDKGRSQIQLVYEKALGSGNTEGLNGAASHLMSNYGDRYKTVNRGFHKMISDLSSNADTNTIADDISNGSYDKYGTDKYTEETLAGADEMAIDRLIGRMNNMTETERSTIQGTARRALTKMQTGNLNVKPEVARKLEELASGVSQLQQMHNEAMKQMGVDSNSEFDVPR